MNEYGQVTIPNYSHVFSFESEFNHQETRIWMQNNWTLSIYFAVIYVVVIFGIQHLMQNRPRFELKMILILWNILLALFSIMGASRTIPEFSHILTHHGFYHSVCAPSYIDQDKVSGFWTWMFALSKVAELGDTLFVALRKQPLIFLQWGHHITALLLAWSIYKEYPGCGRWFVVMNYSVHAVMYFYFALKALGCRVPRQCAMFVTSMQLLQMVIACAINLWSYGLLQTHIKCHISPLIIKLALASYFLFGVLFARFFYKTYISKQRFPKKVVIGDDLLMKFKVQ